MGQLETLCTLAHDEMGVGPTVGYFSKTEQILGPHKKMLVATTRGTVGKYKGPVYLGFDKKMTEALLLEIITATHRSGLTVKGATHKYVNILLRSIRHTSSHLFSFV